MVERDGNPVIKRLYLDQFTLKPTACRLSVIGPDATSVVVNVTETPDLNVYNAEGDFLGVVFHLAQEVLNLPWLVRRFGEAAHSHPDRESLKGFTTQMPIAQCLYFLHNDDTQEDHLIVAIHLTGEFAFVQTEMQFQVSRIGDRAFGSGRGQILGRETVWVGTTDEEKSQTRISWKPLGGRGIEDADALLPTPGSANQFPALQDISAPVDWTEDEEITDGVGFLAVRPRTDGLPAGEFQADT